MIRLTDIDGLAVYIAPSEVASVTALRPNPHTNAIVFMRDGRRHEVREFAKDIAALIINNEASARK